MKLLRDFLTLGLITLPLSERELTGGLTVDRSSTYGLFGLMANIDYLVAQLNAGTGIDQQTLKTPTTNDPLYDTTPIAGLHVQAPSSPSTRNFVSGIWVETNASAPDKGRGIMVSNTGHSDGIYIQQDGTNGVGEAILLTALSTNATGLVIGTTLASHQGLVLRQETGILPGAAGILLVLQAEGALTEMVQIGSATVAAQVGFVFRLYGAGAKPIVVKDSGGIDKFILNNVGTITAAGSPTIQNATAIPAGGTIDIGYMFSSVAHFGVFFGSGVPTLSAAKGSLYLRSDGSSGATRAYINTDGATAWTNITTAA